MILVWFNSIICSSFIIIFNIVFIIGNSLNKNFVNREFLLFL